MPFPNQPKPTVNLNTPIRYLKGIGPKKEELFNRLGVFTVNDLLYYFPFRYEDRTNLKKIKDLEEKETALVKAKVAVRRFKKMPYFMRRRSHVRNIFEIAVSDTAAKINCVWFNQPWLADKIKVNDEVIIYGKVSKKGNNLQFVSPECEIISKEEGDDPLNLGRIVPIYPLTANLNQKFLRKIIFSLLESHHGELKDPLPFGIRQSKNFPNIARALDNMHFPRTWQEAQCARERFIFEELFFSQIMVYLRKARHNREIGPVFRINEAIINKIRNNLDFSLTVSQEEVLKQILKDFAKAFPMRRLLQGDVGCGKTVVAAFAIAICCSNKYQAAFMVPTEVLAYQHKETLDGIFRGLGINMEILISSLPKQKIKKVYEGLKSGDIDMVVGTHALIQQELEFKNLGLAVIDEQHRFGVSQRAMLPKKGKISPHCLVMSATPIPRSLALSLYGDLDLSVIKEKPAVRIMPKTIWVKEDKRKWVYNLIREKLSQGRQAYVIYPLIEESAGCDIKSVQDMAGEIKKAFSGCKVGVFHGELKNEDKIETIEKFKNKKIDILVATTIIEVGISIDNASVMVVESPERFGLAQLHQLRGRIQRANFEPYFILISSGRLSDEAQKRLATIVETSDGFKIAEEDLLSRGPGDFFGSLQHGLPALKIANPLRDLDILKEACCYAYDVIKNDPDLERPKNRSIPENLPFFFRGKLRR